jgi:hypothetical protein
MKKQLIIIGILALLVSVGLSGCSQISNPLNSEKNKFVGTWKVNEATNIFFSDGTCTFSGVSGTWEIKDGLLVITIISEMPSVFSFVFSNNDRTLTLNPVGGGKTIVWTKQ